MATLPKTGAKILYDGIIVEAQESESSCVGCFYLQGDECTCTFNLACADRDNEKFAIFKYVREATDEEIRKGVADV